MAWNKARFIGLLCLIGFQLSACQASYDDQLDDYLDRLENILDVKRSKEQKQRLPPLFFSLPKLPSKRQTQFNFDKDTIDKYTNSQNSSANQDSFISIIEFLSLNECKLQQTIAEKNNNLGKVATTSQQLLNTIGFIQQSPECLTHLKENKRDKLFKKLEQNVHRKQQQLPKLLWQAILNETEYRAFWQTSNRDKTYPESLPPQQLNALQKLTEFTKNTLNKQPSSINLEQHLGIIRLGDGGQLLAAYAQLATQLGIANELIEKALDKPFCQAKITQPNIKILNNMMNVFFVPNIQQWANQLNQRYEKIIPQVYTLEALFTQYEHPDFTRWRLARNRLLKDSKNAIKIHVQTINKLYQQCAAKPGNKTP